MPEELEMTTLDHLYAISKTAFNANDWHEAMEKITHHIRSILIFDNLALFQLNHKTGQLDVIFAKAMGRGKAYEAEISWGEILASKVIDKCTTILEEPDDNDKEDRLQMPHLLGIPIKSNQLCIGVLVLIRFGGPSFSNENIKLAEFVTQQISFVLERQQFSMDSKLINEQLKQIRLQNDFITTISHELRNPLGFIKGYTTTLLRNDASWDSKTQQEFLEIIDQETDHLQKLIENLLDSSRLSSGLMKMEYQNVRLDTLLNDVIARTRLQFPNNKINIKIEAQIKPVQGDPHRLSQVFENLITNAAKYAPDSEIWVKIKQNKEETNVYVQDFGPGIPKKYLPFIYNRFFRNPEQPPGIHGTGLGLYICNQIVKAHNGKILVNSKEGEGTTFEVILPNDYLVNTTLL